MIGSRSEVGSRSRWRFLLATIPLLASCSDKIGTEPSIGAAAVNRVTGTPAVFIVEPTPISVPTYDGSGQAVHPDVVAFDSDWNGAKYWLTMTPYPQSD